jgi:hypothetical protein
MKMAPVNSRRSAFPWLGVLICVSIVSALTANTIAQKSPASENKQVKILSNGLELIEVAPTAPQCGKQKGQTIRLKVTSEAPVDVRLYVHTGYKQWLPKDFVNQKQGDEITDYRCNQKPDYEVYAHAIGSSEAWPKP